MTEWVLGVTGPNMETKVYRALERFGIPNRIFWQRHVNAIRSKLVNRLIPHFSRYVFLPFEHCFRAHELRDYTHISSLVVFGGEVAVLPPGAVDQLERKCTVEDGKFILPAELAPSRFQPGQLIYITGDHQFSGQKVTYLHPVGFGRHVVEVDMMGRVVPIELDEHSLDESVAPSRKRKRRRPGRRQRLKSSTV